MNAREIAIVIFVSKTRHECKKSSLTRSQVAHLFPVVIAESFSYISSRRNFLFLYFDGLFFLLWNFNFGTSLQELSYQSSSLKQNKWTVTSFLPRLYARTTQQFFIKTFSYKHCLVLDTNMSRTLHLYISLVTSSFFS